MLTARAIKFIRLTRRLKEAKASLEILGAAPYDWCTECQKAHLRQVIQYREYKLKSFMEPSKNVQN